MSRNNGSAQGSHKTQAFVCMIAYTDYPNDGRVRREAETLAAAGFHVTCLTTQLGETPTEELVRGVWVRELAVRRYQGKSAAAYLASYVSFLAAASFACMRLRLKRRLDVVHAHNLPDFLVLAGLVPRMFGAKVVLDVHDSIPETFMTKFSNSSLVWKALCFEERMSARVAHRVICVNHPQRDTLVARGIPTAKTFISMNVPDPDIFRLGETVPASTVGFNLIYHGTMAKRLGVDLLVRAMAKLRTRVPGIQLHLWGGGDDLTSIQELVRELHVEDVVRIVPGGFVLDQLPHRLQAMDLGVVGNRRNSAADLMLPVKLMEYVSLGIPTVVPGLPAIEYYFSSDMVSYYTPEDVESLCDAICRMHEAPDARRQQATKAGNFLAEYGWERQGPALVTFYQNLLES